MILSNSLPHPKPPSRTEFYQEHLDRVSRSFAFCIARLEPGLRETISLGYLLCRLIDTVEDAPWKSASEQMEAFAAFDRFLQAPPNVEDCQYWKKSFPQGVPDQELRLLEDACEIFADFHALKPRDHEALHAPIKSMSAGMQHYQLRRWREGELRLRDLRDVNEYCFFVAGVVGEMLARLTVQQSDLADAYRFGLFLQKVNLLKDAKSDEACGRFLVPDVESVKQSLLSDAVGALRFLTAIPIHETGFRLFCAWSLYLGLSSLKWIASGKKIPRAETMALLIEIEEMIGSNSSLKTRFEELLMPLYSQPPALEVSALYSGILASWQIEALLR